MKEEKAPIKNFKPALIQLFKQMGLNVQASNIERNVANEELTYLEAYVLFKKHQIDVSVQKCSKQILKDVLFPFIWVSGEGLPTVMRYIHDRFESLDERNEWVTISTQPDSGYVFIIDSLPNVGTKTRFFCYSLFKTN